MSTAQPVEGRNIVFDVGGKMYPELPPRRQSDPATTEGDVKRTRKSMIKNQLSASDFEFMATRLGGDTFTGVAFCSELGAKCNRGAFRYGADNVGEKVDVRLTAPTSIAIQAKLGLSDHQCRELNGVLTAVNRTPVFAPKQDMLNCRKESVKGLKQTFDKKTVEITKNFVTLWRKTFPGYVTPKVHVLETHAC
jgi:hypothetical protein